MIKDYNKENKRDRFITDTLLAYIVDHIDDSEDKDKTARKAASMYIFPYRTMEGIKLGSLLDSDTGWYFSKDKKVYSSGSYRVLADEVFKNKDQFENFRKTFSDLDYISEFSDVVVINDLINKMENETVYSELWWTYAYDVLLLCLDKEEYTFPMTKATANMDNNSFMFLPGYCSEELRNRLIKYGVFSDIISESAKRVFWSKLKNESVKTKAISMLQRMGVPSVFCKGNDVNENILRFVELQGNDGAFPVRSDDDSFERYSVVHEILWKHVLSENADSFKNIANDDYLSKGLVIRNVKGEYIPLSVDLFYYDAKKYDCEGIQNDSDVFLQSKSVLERLHIDENSYTLESLALIENVHEFSDVDLMYEDYYIDVDIADTYDNEFYMWIWSYSQHNALIDNILRFYTGEEDVTDACDVNFVLNLLSLEYVNDNNYCFAIHLDADTAFKYYNVLKRIKLEFEYIDCVVEDNGVLLDKTVFFPQLTGAIKDASAYQKVLTDDIWDNVCVVDRESNQYYGKYVVCIDENGCREILLCKSENTESYIIALSQYAADFFNVEVSIDNLADIDWKKAYINLINGIRSFINDEVDIVSIDEVYKYTIDLNDIDTFGEEKALWHKLKQQRKSLFETEDNEIPFELLENREFLKSTYNGRCQLCAGITPKSVQDSYFYTYRIVKESKNPLANMRYNLFCLCPTCHSELGYGRFMGQNMKDIVEKASMYASYIEDKINSGEMEDHFPCLVQELVDHEVEIDGFKEPIVCNVIVNGKDRRMSFSWRHFIKLAFVFSDINDFDEEDDFEYKKEDANNPVNIHHDVPFCVSHPHGYVTWHGTEWVSGHYRARNGHTEYVKGHWRTR